MLKFAEARKQNVRASGDFARDSALFAGVGPA
jgi:quinolinate synthase